MHCKLLSKATIASDFSTLLCIKQGEKRKRYHPKSDFRLWLATYFSTKKPINKLAMNNRRLLIAAEFHFVHSVEKRHLKTSQVDTKLNFVGFSCQSKQVKKCCINFPHELSCQVLTNQSIKIGRRARPTRDLGEKVNSNWHVFPVCKNWLNFSFLGQFEMKF